MVAVEFFVNCYNFNAIIQVKKGNFQGILKGYLEPEPKFGFAATWSREPKPKKIYSAPQHCFFPFLLRVLF